MGYERFHWLAFNAGGKIFGFGLFVIAGLIALVTAIQLLNGDMTVTMNGIPEEAPNFKIGLTIVMVVLSALGLLMLIAKPYRPDKASPNE